MVRHRFTADILYGRYRDFFEISEQLQALETSRGWAQAGFWIPTVGALNSFVIEWEYPDLASFERETRARFSDTEYMGLVRRTSELVAQGSARDELIESARQIA